nr:hypothetical protein [Allomuricauda sp.]
MEKSNNADNEAHVLIPYKIIMVWSITVFAPLMLLGQQSIQPNDIEIHSQLTLLTVSPDEVSDFEGDMNALSELSRQVELEEQYDWLTYKSDKGQYLIVNFSSGISDALTLEEYRKGFQKKGGGEAFDTIMDAMLKHSISVDKNCLIQMLLPWSTVREISVLEFPLATMVEYQIPTKNIESFDSAMRKLVALLKKVEYPYPLESNRGSLGAYGTMNLVWFYDDRDAYFGNNSLDDWMGRHGNQEEFRVIMETIEGLSLSTKAYNFSYQGQLSY